MNFSFQKILFTKSVKKTCPMDSKFYLEDIECDLTSDGIERKIYSMLTPLHR